MTAFSLAAYHAFLEAKIRLDKGSGFEVPLEQINPSLKPLTRLMVQWMLRGGRRALFAKFGLHKTVSQLEVMRLIGLLDPCLRLIVLPLGVRQEFRLDAEAHFRGEFAIKVKFIRSNAEIEDLDTIYITNYESVREETLDISVFGAISLDEAAVLRSFGSKTFGAMLFGAAQLIKYRFVATATPDPNEYLELIAYAHFLGVMDMGEAKTRFFKRNSEKADQLTLHQHKEKEFWLWVASWALFVQRPSDLGCSDEGYVMPELDVYWHELPSDHTDAGETKNGQGLMFKAPAVSVGEAAREKRSSLPARIDKLLELRALATEYVDPPGQGSVKETPHCLIWHDLEAERHEIEKACPGVATIYGTQDLEEREQLVLGFRNGEIAELAAKPVMLGAGGNLQLHCHWEIFLGIGHKFNDFIQAIHRLQRFGQKHRVRVDLIYTEAEREIRRSLESKWNRHNHQAEVMSGIIREYGLNTGSIELTLKRSMGVERREETGPGWRLVLNDAVEEAYRTETNSIDLIVTSIPFSTQYEYTPSYNDFGHTDTEEHFFEQMGFLSPELARALKPGAVMAVHVKDRVAPGAITGMGFQSISPFHAHAILHYRRHGLVYMGMITVVTDVVKENDQTYRLGWGMQCEDGTRMGVGLPEYVLLFRKPPTDASKGWADERVTKTQEEYTRGRWQCDAHGFWRSSGNRLLQAADVARMKPHQLSRLFRDVSANHVYDYERDVAFAEACDAHGMLPPTFMLLQPQSHCDDVWADVVRMVSLNSQQGLKGREKHLCPLPIDIVDRLINRFSKPGMVVADFFSGLGTVPLRAVQLGRKALACELNPEYFGDGVTYLRAANDGVKAPTLFDAIDEEAREAA